jgi:ribosomal protein S18 acetylase RimI-like enzyme
MAARLAGSLMGLPTPELRFEWVDAGNHEEALAAFLDGIEVGSLVVGNSRISDLDVNPAFQRQGIASALYREALSEWGELEHGLLTDEGKAWLEAIEPGGSYERDESEPDYWVVL